MKSTIAARRRSRTVTEQNEGGVEGVDIVENVGMCAEGTTASKGVD